MVTASGARRRAIAPLLVVVFLAACSAAPSSPDAAERHGTASTTAPASEPQLHLDITMLRCGDVIATAESPSPGHSVVLGEVALPTETALQANPSGQADPGGQLFAKDGLLIRPGASVELVVPDIVHGQASIGWGNPAIRTRHLVIEGCGSTTTTSWLVYAGGYWVAEPTCLPLVVKAGGASRQVSIGVGTPCPGRAPSPPTTSG
ncbi:MAG: hypothetical protein LC808_33955 [Actinobacteria bacterium]|nr:hypothetical protein [Actinomycetota bacterium]